MAMSGGIDSTVAALMLHKEGYERLPSQTKNTFPDKGASVITSDWSGYGDRQGMQDDDEGSEEETEIKGITKFNQYWN